MKQIRQWLKFRQTLKRVRDRKAGYNWAAGALLRGTPVRAVTDAAWNAAHESAAFDEGALLALRDWHRLHDRWRAR